VDRVRRKTVVVVPTCGQRHLLEALLGDIERERELVDLVVVDNATGGDVPRWVHVLRLPTNIGWLTACNLGLAHAAAGKYAATVLLNDDTRLSAGFFEGLVRAWDETGAGLVGPVYDDVWPQQRVPYAGVASGYAARAEHRRVAFVDGTCMLVPMDVYASVGPLDARCFGRHGWGADFDLALRVRLSGRGVYVTELAYLNHLRGASARALDARWEDSAGAEMNEGMRVKWGLDWGRLLDAGATGPPRAKVR
jgi:GT2 family glycosyltransferase